MFYRSSKRKSGSVTVSVNLSSENICLGHNNVRGYGNTTGAIAEERALCGLLNCFLKVNRCLFRVL